MMRYFTVDYEYWTHPWHHAGRCKRDSASFAAGSQWDAMKLANEEGKRRFGRRKWKIVKCEAIPVLGVGEQA